MRDIAQTVAQSLGDTFNLCLVYLVGSIGLVLLIIGVFKFAAWIADRRRDAIEPCIRCGGEVEMATPIYSRLPEVRSEGVPGRRVC